MSRFTGPRAYVYHACLCGTGHALDGLKKLMQKLGMPDASASRMFARAQTVALGYWNDRA